MVILFYFLALLPIIVAFIWFADGRGLNRTIRLQMPQQGTFRRMLAQIGLISCWVWVVIMSLIAYGYSRPELDHVQVVSTYLQVLLPVSIVLTVLGLSRRRH